MFLRTRLPGEGHGRAIGFLLAALVFGATATLIGAPANPPVAEPVAGEFREAAGLQMNPKPAPPPDKPQNGPLGVLLIAMKKIGQTLAGFLSDTFGAEAATRIAVVAAVVCAGLCVREVLADPLPTARIGAGYNANDCRSTFRKFWKLEGRNGSVAALWHEPGLYR